MRAHRRLTAVVTRDDASDDGVGDGVGPSAGNALGRWALCETRRRLCEKERPPRCCAAQLWLTEPSRLYGVVACGALLLCVALWMWAAGAPTLLEPLRVALLFAPKPTYSCTPLAHTAAPGVPPAFSRSTTFDTVSSGSDLFTPEYAFAATSNRSFTLAVIGLWSPSPRAVLSELWLLRCVVLRALHAQLAPLPDSLPVERAAALADFILVGPYLPLPSVEVLLHRRKADSVALFVGPENSFRSDWAGLHAYRDQMVGAVDVSLGHRRDISHFTYLRLPWWLPYALDRGAGCACQLPRNLSRGAGGAVAVPAALAAAAAWAARPHFAALVSSHYDFPRPQLWRALSGAGYGPVHAPGRMVHNMEWPEACFPNSHTQPEGKVAFLRSFRFNICPENSLSPDGGYATEKLAQALLAGTVPIYWGDPPDADVWNPRRVLSYVSSAGSLGELVSAVAELQGNASARLAWFGEPELAPGADAWVADWVRNASALVAAAAARRGLPVGVAAVVG